MSSHPGDGTTSVDQDDDWAECFKAAVDVAKQAGKWIIEAYEAEKEFLTKSSYADLVTETDKRVEDMIIATFRKLYPTHSFIGEESVKEGEHSVLTDNPTWIIDPIDGTTNFVHRFPVVAVSIALVANRKAVLGIVYNPITDEMFSARVGHGAYCNDRKLCVSQTEELSRALICAEFGNSRGDAELSSKFNSMRSVLEAAHGLRSLGSAALNMCYVAAGRTDAYWEYGIHAWDVAAGDLIVREAGGVVMSTTGQALDLLDRQVLCAGNEKLALQISKRISHAVTLERD